jgi:hypothetical protein
MQRIVKAMGLLWASLFKALKTNPYKNTKALNSLKTLLLMGLPAL